MSPSPSSAAAMPERGKDAGQPDATRLAKSFAGAAMRLRLFFFLVGALVTVPVVVASGRTPAQGPGAAYLLSFDPATVETVEGKILRIHQVPQARVWLTGVQAQLQLKQGELSVQLGPAWFIDNQELHLEVNDRITVTGSRVRPGGVDSLIAMDVRRGDAVLHLRAPDGMPVWVAWRWRTSERSP